MIGLPSSHEQRYSLYSSVVKLSMTDISNSFVDGAIAFTEIWLWMLYIVFLDLEPWENIPELLTFNPMLRVLYNLDWSIVVHRHEAQFRLTNERIVHYGYSSEEKSCLFSERVCLYRYLVSFSGSLWIFLGLIVANLKSCPGWLYFSDWLFVSVACGLCPH